MSRPNKNKLPTSNAPGPGLFQAFAGLDIGGLPDLAPGPPAVDAPAAPDRPAKLGRVVLRRETAHRGGKCVVVVDGFDPALDDEYLERLSKKLRAACGCGGTLKERTIELQGDQPTKVRELLVAEGFRVAGVG